MSPASTCTGDYCLDECSGQLKEIPALDKFKYRYYITGPTSDLVSLPSSPKPATSDSPFTIKCYKGCTWTELSSNAAKCSRGTTGVASAYTAQALTGYTAVYSSTAASGLKCGTGSNTNPNTVSTTNSNTVSTTDSTTDSTTNSTTNSNTDSTTNSNTNSNTDSSTTNSNTNSNTDSTTNSNTNVATTGDASHSKRSSTSLRSLLAVTAGVLLMAERAQQSPAAL